MDQNLRASNRQALNVSDEQVLADNSPLRDPELDKPAHSSAMVLVLGLTALLSMAVGFLLGLLF